MLVKDHLIGSSQMTFLKNLKYDDLQFQKQMREETT